MRWRASRWNWCSYRKRWASHVVLPLEKEWQPTAVFLPGKSHGQRSLVCYRPWGCKESNMTEQLSVHAHACTRACAHTHTHIGGYTEARDRQFQAEELQCVTYEQILQDEDNSRRLKGEAEPYLDKRHRPLTSHPWGQGDLPDYTCAERLLEGQKGSDVNLLLDLFAGILLG